MFVSIAIDPSSADRGQALAELLSRYGFKNVQHLLWETMTISPETLARLKRDLNFSTGANDKLRFFQFPMEGTLVLSSLRNKHWRRMTAKIYEEAPKKNVSSARTPPAKPGSGKKSK